MSDPKDVSPKIPPPSEVLVAPVSLRAGLTPEEILREIVAWIDVSQKYLRSNKRSFRRKSTVLRFATIFISAIATIILGLQNLSFWPGLAFALVSVLTVLNTIEPFFAWRSRWVLMEEAQYKMHRLKDEIAFTLSSSPSGGVTSDQVEIIYGRYQETWDALSQGWLEHRRHDN